MARICNPCHGLGNAPYLSQSNSITMKRLHLFEFEDFSWFPAIIRNYITDYLQQVTNSFDFYKPLVPVLAKGVQKSGTNQILDMASGGGGGWLKLAEHIKEELPGVTVKLSDLYPNIAAYKAVSVRVPNFFTYSTEPVNCLDVPADLKGLRTQFLSLHHFKPMQAVQILDNAVKAGQPILLVEGQKRDLKHFIQFFFSPIGVLLLTPAIRPFRLLRILLTYILPVVPLFVWWDGLVSVLRTYSQGEMRDMTELVPEGATYTWEIGELSERGVTLQYLLGYPKELE